MAHLSPSWIRVRVGGLLGSGTSGSGGVGWHRVLGLMGLSSRQSGIARSGMGGLPNPPTMDIYFSFFGISDTWLLMSIWLSYFQLVLWFI